jgi:hypothetical protein
VVLQVLTILRVQVRISATPLRKLLLWIAKLNFVLSTMRERVRAEIGIDRGITDSMLQLTPTTAPSLSRALHLQLSPYPPPLCIHIRACRYRIQSHPFLKKNKDARAPHTVSPITKVSLETLPRVHVQGQFGHSVNLDQSLVANRGDIVQKYSSVTKQRGFQDAGALQELHAEHRQRTLQLPFPNPAPPSMERSSFIGDASRKTALQTIQCVAAAFNIKQIFALTIFNQFSFADIRAFMSPFPRMKPSANFFWTVCCLALRYQPTHSRHQHY